MFLPRRLLSPATSPSIRTFATSLPARTSVSALDACNELKHRFGGNKAAPISSRTQRLDANQLHLLSLTLGRQRLHRPPSTFSSTSTSTESEPPKIGTSLPPAYHLAYFTPPFLEQDLGPDGSDKSVNPLRPWTRRMWAGGEIHWSNDKDKDGRRWGLRIGDLVREVTRLRSAEVKRAREGGEMLVVGVEKEYFVGGGEGRGMDGEGTPVVRDRREWVFRREVDGSEGQGSAQAYKIPLQEPLPEGPITRDFIQTPVSLFRFSALTFNAHKIHYSRDWCRAVEGHRDCVVHGPLNLINILDLWRDKVRGGREGVLPVTIKYRAKSPLYVGEKYRILLTESEGGGVGDRGNGWEAEIVDSYGRVAMVGSIEEGGD
ncbi:hypothetical protein BCR34DRAFT_583173 [Clohesyomyces aquaticus]|uniref:HotDog domain-containing protein n=1 Tax=Clohesyomyces aquaticus TaxID=1231657 RepID=A0A1Y2A6X5_9PLEO|nr:hypothetical protein BCR34DRAFT_583173 [Clohesyomyces aquaticus]